MNTTAKGPRPGRERLGGGRPRTPREAFACGANRSLRHSPARQIERLPAPIPAAGIGFGRARAARAEGYVNQAVAIAQGSFPGYSGQS